MIKTQIQIPDELYRDLKRLAKRKEWSLAETLRRGGEQMLEMYTDQAMKQQDWTPPSPRHIGWKNLSAEEMHHLALQDMEPRLP